MDSRRRFLLVPLCLLPLPALAKAASTVSATFHAGNVAQMTAKLHPITALVPVTDELAGGGFHVPSEWRDQVLRSFKLGRKENG